MTSSNRATASNLIGPELLNQLVDMLPGFDCISGH
jgi:hypothetical protein